MLNMWHTFFTNRQNILAPKGPSSVAQEYKTEHDLHSCATEEGPPFGVKTFCLLVKKCTTSLTLNYPHPNEYPDVVMNLYSIIDTLLHIPVYYVHVLLIAHSMLPPHAPT